MSYNPKSLFSQIQKKEQAVAASAGTSQFNNEYLLKPTKPGTLTVRLLWLPPIKGAQRDYPMINSYIHEFYDATTKKYGKVVCSTSQYLDGETPAGFKNCPVCNEVSKFYKKGQEGSASAQELYKNFRRTCRGYIPVYVVNGTVNGEDISGQIRILQYGKQFKDFFNSKIFGIAAKANGNDDAEPISEDEIIGLDAFMYYNEDANKIETTGYDFIITTTTQPMNIGGRTIQMPQYRLDFSRKVKSIDVINNIDLTEEAGVEFFKNINNDISFDKDFLIVSTESDRQEFVTKFIIKNEEESINEPDDISVEEAPQPPKKKASTATKKITPPPEDDDQESSSAGEDIDVDSLLEGLNSK